MRYAFTLMALCLAVALGAGCAQRQPMPAAKADVARKAPHLRKHDENYWPEIRKKNANYKPEVRYFH